MVLAGHCVYHCARRDYSRPPAIAPHPCRFARAYPDIHFLPTNVLAFELPHASRSGRLPGYVCVDMLGRTVALARDAVPPVGGLPTSRDVLDKVERDAVLAAIAANGLGPSVAGTGNNNGGSGSSSSHHQPPPPPARSSAGAGSATSSSGGSAGSSASSSSSSSSSSALAALAASGAIANNIAAALLGAAALPPGGAGTGGVGIGHPFLVPFPKKQQPGAAPAAAAGSAAAASAPAAARSRLAAAFESKGGAPAGKGASTPTASSVASSVSTTSAPALPTLPFPGGMPPRPPISAAAAAAFFASLVPPPAAGSVPWLPRPPVPGIAVAVAPPAAATGGSSSNSGSSSGGSSLLGLSRKLPLPPAPRDFALPDDVARAVRESGGAAAGDVGRGSSAASAVGGAGGQRLALPVDFDGPDLRAASPASSQASTDSLLDERGNLRPKWVKRHVPGTGYDARNKFYVHVLPRELDVPQWRCPAYGSRNRCVVAAVATLVAGAAVAA